MSSIVNNLETTHDMKESRISWIGEIPRDWKVIRVKNEFKPIKRVVGQEVDKYERLALTLNGVIKRSKEDAEGLQPEKFEGYQILKENELVFKLIDLENLKTSRVGLSAYCGLVSPAYIILTNGSHDNRFSYYYFMSLYYGAIFNSLGGDGVRSALNKNDLLNIPYVCPPTHEQQPIANYLDEQVRKIDQLIAEQKQAIENWKAYKKSLITEKVTKGLNSSVQMKDSGIEWIGEIPRDWKAIRVKNEFKAIKRVVGQEVDKYERLALTLNGVIKRSKEDAEGLQPEKFEGYQILKENELVFKLIDLENLKTSRVGLSAYCGLVSPAYIILTNGSHDNRFSYYYFMSLYYGAIFNSLGGDGVRSALNKDDLLNIPYICPPIHEQQNIANYLNEKCSKIDQMIEQKQVFIRQLEEYKQSLIYECVTGKRCVL